MSSTAPVIQKSFFLDPLNTTPSKKEISMLVSLFLAIVGGIVLIAVGPKKSLSWCADRVTNPFSRKKPSESLIPLSPEAKKAQIEMYARALNQAIVDDTNFTSDVWEYEGEQFVIIFNPYARNYKVDDTYSSKKRYILAFLYSEKSGSRKELAKNIIDFLKATWCPKSSDSIDEAWSQSAFEVVHVHDLRRFIIES